MNSNVDAGRARFRQAVQAHSQGNFQEAIRICRGLLKDFGERADVLSLLAMSQYKSGDVKGAIVPFEKLAMQTQGKQELTNLAILYQQSGQYAKAEKTYADLLERAPDPQLWNNLGTVYQAQKQPERAIRAYRESLALEPGKSDAQHNLALALAKVQEHGEAIRLLEELLSRNPGNVRARFDLAGVMEAVSRDTAFEIYREIAGTHQHAPSWVALGRLCNQRRRLSDARTCLQNALRLAPDSEEALAEFSQHLIQHGELDEARGFMQKLERLYPDRLDVWRVRVAYHMSIGDYQRVLQDIERIRQEIPDDFNAISVYLFHLHYAHELSPAAVFEAHRQLGARISENAPARIEAPRAADATAGKLRIGLVSPDFRGHAVSRFVLPLLRHYDREQFEFHCYGEDVQRDAVTDEIAALADGWRSTVELSDHDLASAIREDGIAVLIDLAGYTTRTRVTVFALKPAPIQVSWLGYPDTTGLAEIDYRISDRVADPEPEADGFFTERLIRMEDSFLSYEPAADVEIAAAPCATGDMVTFASFNNRAKHNEAVVALWSEILRGMPASRLLLKDRLYGRRDIVEEVCEQFEAHGVGRQRLEFIPHLESLEDHLAMYNQVDIALDPFPYNGTTTSCDALWMGVPIVCLYGDRHSARVTASLLTQLAMGELVTGSAEDYRDRAIALARDRTRISTYKQQIRDRFLRSKLGDGEAFTREFETILRGLSAR